MDSARRARKEYFLMGPLLNNLVDTDGGFVLTEFLNEYPIGESIAQGNWENDVYALGSEFVLKATKDPETLEEVVNREVRYLLLQYWNSEQHFLCATHDLAVLRHTLKDFLPSTLLVRQPLLHEVGRVANITVQTRVFGLPVQEHIELLQNEPAFCNQASGLAEQVRQSEVQLAGPLDFHLGNLMWDESAHRLYLYDTGTPSDWSWILNEAYMADAFSLPPDQAQYFVYIMGGHRKKHQLKSAALVARFSRGLLSTT